MNRAMLRKVFADLRAHRLQTALIFVVLAASAATLTLSLTISRAADEPWERAFEEANGAHITLSTFQIRPGDRRADLTRATSLAGVEATSGSYAVIDTSALIVDGDRHDLVVQEAPEILPTVNRPLIAEGHWSSTPGDIVLDRALARKLGIEVGDTVSLLSVAGLVDVRVAGLAVSPWRGPAPDWDPLAYIARDTLRQLEPDETAWGATLGLRLSDPAQTAVIIGSVFQRFADAPVGISTWDDVREDVVFWNEVNGIFLGMFSVFALVAVGLIVANLISARVLAQYRDIGLLKAVGFTPGQITRAFLLEHLLVTLAASLLGVAIGTAIAPLFLRRLAESMNTTAVPALDPLTLVVVPLGVLLVVAIFTAVPSWRGGRISTIAAITSGAVASQRGPSRLAWLARRLRFSPIVTLGLKDSFARPLRSFMTVAALILTIVTIIFTLGVEAIFDRVFNDPAVQGEPYHITVHPGRVSDADTAAILDADPGIASWHTRTMTWAVLDSTLTTPGPGSSRMQDGFPLRVVDGNVQDAGYIITEGRMFERPGEVIVARGILERFELQVGDTVDVLLDGRPVQLTITGLYLDDDNDGRIAMTHVETAGTASTMAKSLAFLVNLRPGVQEATVVASLLAASGYQFELWTRSDEAEADAQAHSLRVVLAGLSGVLLVIGIVNMLSTTVLSVRERMRDIGVFRAIGLTPAQIITSVMSGIGFLALLAAVIGIPLGLWVYKTIYDVLVVGSLDGDPAWFINPPWWQVALVLPGAMAVAVLASVVPARHAARIEVARVLRYE